MYEKKLIYVIKLFRYTNINSGLFLEAFKILNATCNFNKYISRSQISATIIYPLVIFLYMIVALINIFYLDYYDFWLRVEIGIYSVSSLPLALDGSSGTRYSRARWCARKRRFTLSSRCYASWVRHRPFVQLWNNYNTLIIIVIVILFFFFFSVILWYYYFILF